MRPSEYSTVEKAVKLLPPKRRGAVIAAYNHGLGLLDAHGFGGGMIASFWSDCIAGEICNMARRTGKLKHEGYMNSINDHYIDSRCGRAPRKQLRKLQEDLKLLINEDWKPCAICGTPTDKTLLEQHEGREKERHGWEVSAQRMRNWRAKRMEFTEDSSCCWTCYQDKLVKQSTIK